MKQKSSRLTIAILTLSIICGILLGNLISGNCAKYQITSPQINVSASSEHAEFILYIGRSTVIQATLIFLSGFTAFSLPISAFILAARSFSSFRALFYCSDAGAISIFVSYCIITATLVLLTMYAASYSKQDRQSKNVFTTAKYSYGYMMICGASILIRAAPFYLIQILK